MVAPGVDAANGARCKSAKSIGFKPFVVHARRCRRVLVHYRFKKVGSRRMQKKPLTVSAYVERILKARVYDVAIESPLEPAPLLSRRLNNAVWLKREDLQPVFSFK